MDCRTLVGSSRGRERAVPSDASMNCVAWTVLGAADAGGASTANFNVLRGGGLALLISATTSIFVLSGTAPDDKWGTVRVLPNVRESGDSQCMRRGADASVAAAVVSR